MKRYAALILAILTAALALFSAGCDPRGQLSEKETQMLYEEFRALAASDEFWQRETHLWLGPDWSIDAEEQAAVEFVKAVVETALSDKTEKTISGSWFSSKKYCSDVSIKIDGPVHTSDTREGMRTKVTAAKYGDGKWVIFVEEIEPGSEMWSTVIQIAFY
ncbi:MAG: hypothetical protein J5586_08290 [Clostridia bacterium]|nr:hypothetical protein [Clostridia bacterium]